MEWVVIEPMVRWVRTLKMQTSVEVIGVSNADATAEEWLQRFDLWGLFDHALNSARVGVAKPDPAIYRMAFKYTAYSPQTCLFIDDRDQNMPAAQHLGIRTVMYRGFDDFAHMIEEYFPGSVQCRHKPDIRVYQRRLAYERTSSLWRM